MARVKHFKISLWNLATKSAPFLKKIGDMKLRHKYSAKFAKIALKKVRDHEMKSDIVHRAAYLGIYEIVKLGLDDFPELKWDEKLIETVVEGRHVKLFGLFNTQNTMAFFTDKRSVKRVMEKVIQWSPERLPADIAGAAFRMQSELQWFKVLQHRSDASFRSQSFKEEKHKSDPSSQSLVKTHWEDFVEKHRLLLEDARKWMKDTSESCSLVATLIITIVFTAAFAVPGGNDTVGIPIFLKKGSFMVFAIADALALFSSVTATLMFLAILTSRYAIEDFLHSLPRKMILGLTFLFLSLAFMLVAFGSALVIVLGERLKWIYIPITVLAAFPVVLFAKLHLPLYVEMFISTYWPHLHLP